MIEAIGYVAVGVCGDPGRNGSRLAPGQAQRNCPRCERAVKMEPHLLAGFAFLTGMAALYVVKSDRRLRRMR